MGTVSVLSPNNVKCTYSQSDKGIPTWEMFQNSDSGKPFYAETRAAVQKKYGIWGDVWPKVPILSDATQRSDKTYIALFGEISNRNLFQDHLVLLDFANHEGIKSVYNQYKTYYQNAPLKIFRKFGVNCLMPKANGTWKWDYNNVGQVTINKSIEKIFVQTFKEVFLKCMEIGYYVWDIHTWSYRAKSTHGGKSYFEELLSGKPVPVEILSNHSLGLAIDINPSTNGDSATVWDIPSDIVQIFRKNGFWWGAEYKERYDSMHFEYKLPYLLNIGRPVCLPLSQITSSATPLKYLKINEAGQGGFYPVGLSQNLHTGVHLAAQTKNSEIRCLTSGYIVAARLMAKDQAGDNAILQNFIGNQHLGFIVIRHEIEKVDSSGNNETLPIYSLYMHLAPPEWENATDLYYVNVPWFKKIIEMRYGGVVDLNSSSASIGKNLWATETIPGNATEFKVSGGTILKAQTNGMKTAIAKSAPEDVTEAINAFKKGYMVSFSSPVLPVQAGEVIGYANPLSSSSPAIIHWELFSEAGQNSAFEKLKSIDSDIATLFQRISETRNDNFFEMPKPDGSGNNELQPLLINKLPPDDQSFMSGIISTTKYKEKLLDFFNKAQSFSNESLDDAATAETFTYPVSITVNNPYSYSGPAANTPVNVSVSFKKDGAVIGKKGKLTISDFNNLNFKIQVPADADTLCLDSENCSFAPIPLSKLNPSPKESSFLKPVLQYRWRNIILSHITEWKQDGLNLLLDKLDENMYLTQLLTTCEAQKDELVNKGLIQNSDTGVAMLKKLLLPLAWWGRQIDSSLEIYGGENAVCGGDESEKSIFGSLLPDDGKIDSMHPVTATWLIQMLESSGKIKIKTTFPNATFTRVEDSGKLVWKGWITVSSTPPLGSPLHAVAVQHGYGSGSKIKFLGLKSGSTAPLTLGEIATVDGIAILSKDASMWGTWTLKVKDAADSDIPCDDSTEQQFTIAKPEIQGNSLPVKPPAAKSSEYSGTITVSKNCPKSLHGFLYLRYWTFAQDKEPDYSTGGSIFSKTFAVSTGAVTDVETTVAGVKYKRNYVIGGSGTIEGVKKFGVNEFKKVYKDNDSFKVYLPLCQKLQTIRGEGAEPKITIDSVIDGGRTLIIHPSSGKATDYSTIKTSAENLAQNGDFTVSEEQNHRLKLNMPESQNGSGTLSVVFNPSGLLSELYTYVNPAAGNRIFTRPSILIPNGGHEVVGDEASNQTHIINQSPDQIKSLCNNDFIELQSEYTFPALEVQGFGKPFFTMSEKLLYINIPLTGEPKLWQKAVPVVEVTDNKAFKSTGTVTNNVLNVSWNILNKDNETWYRKGLITFNASLKNPSVFTNVPQFAPVQYDATPKLLPLDSPVIAGQIVIIRGKANCMFTDIDLKIICEQMVDNSWEEDSAATAKIAYTGRKDKSYGRCDAQGNFEAVLQLSEIKDDNPRRFVWKRTLSEGKVHGIPVPEQTSSEFTRTPQTTVQK